MKKINKEKAWLIIIGLMLLYTDIIFKQFYPLNDFTSGVTKGIGIVVLIRFFSTIHRKENQTDKDKQIEY